MGCWEILQFCKSDSSNLGLISCRYHSVSSPFTCLTIFPYLKHLKNVNTFLFCRPSETLTTCCFQSYNTIHNWLSWLCRLARMELIKLSSQAYLRTSFYMSSLTDTNYKPKFYQVTKVNVYLIYNHVSLIIPVNLGVQHRYID